MPILDSGLSDLRNQSVTERFGELADKLNDYLHKFRAFGIRSNRAVAQYLCVDSAELSRLKNARVGDINLQRGYEILEKCQELERRLATFGGPLKCRDVHSVGFSISALPAVSTREQTHAIALQQQSDTVLLTVDDESQCRELDMLLGDVMRSVVNARRNPYGPMSIMYVLKSVYACPSTSREQLLASLRVVALGRRACEFGKFHPQFGEEVRRRTLAAILNNGAAIALRAARVWPQRSVRVLRLSKFLHAEALKTFYFPSTIRGALTCANDLEDGKWAAELIQLFLEREGWDVSTWPRGIQADIKDPSEWQYLKRHKSWKLFDGVLGRLR